MVTINCVDTLRRRDFNVAMAHERIVGKIVAYLRMQMVLVAFGVVGIGLMIYDRLRKR